MKLFDYKLIFIAITTLLCIPIFIPTIYEVLPEREHEKFVSLGILGKDGLADNYYPTADSIIYEDILNKWQIYIHNNFGESTQLLLKIKILEPNIDPPNISTCLPCSGFEVFEIRRVISKNQTVTIPFHWMITDLNEKENRSVISEIQINNQTRILNISCEKNETIRVVCELWVFDTNDNKFHFNWIDLEEKRCVWTQIQFKITSNS